MPIARWKLLAAVALHFVLPAYLVTLAVDAAMGKLGQNLTLAAPKAFAFTGRFLLAYVAIAAVACGAAALWDRWSPAKTHAVHLNPDTRFTGILARARGRFGSEGDAAILALTLAGPHVPNWPALTDDLDALVDAALAAIDAEPARSGAIASDTAEALTRMSDWAVRQARADAEQAGDGARIQTIFVNTKYGSDNF